MPDCYALSFVLKPLWSCIPLPALGVIYDYLPQVRELVRDQVEKDLTFAGFVIISCPLKSDSKAAIKEVLHSSHGVSFCFAFLAMLCTR